MLRRTVAIKGWWRLRRLNGSVGLAGVKCAFLVLLQGRQRTACSPGELGCTNELLLPCVTWRLTLLSTLVRLALESGEPICCCNCADQRGRGSTSPPKRFKLLQHVLVWSGPLRVIVGSTEIDSTRTSQFRFHPIPAISPTATAQASLLARRCLLLSPLHGVLVPSVRVLLFLSPDFRCAVDSLSLAARPAGGGQTHRDSADRQSQCLCLSAGLRAQAPFDSDCNL